MPIITLLTDFGLTDPFVGEMKAVLLRVAPDLDLVDLTHGIAPGNTREGAWILKNSWRLFSEGTCHLAVIDPGVGGRRRRLAARAGGHLFVGPDNGLLAPALGEAGDSEIREIESGGEPDRRGTTFDGRDLFAPVAARLARGMPFGEVGPPVAEPVAMEPFSPRARSGGWEVEVVRIDRYGNAITVAPEAFLGAEFGVSWREISLQAGEVSIRGIRAAYEEVPAGSPLLTIGSCGTLEISVRGGSAADALGLSAGKTVFLVGPEGI